MPLLQVTFARRLLHHVAASPKSGQRNLRNASALALVPLLLLLVVIFYRKIALTNLILVDHDLLTYFYPYKEAAASALREGRFPLWNPYLFTGAPFMANPQTALLYPLNLPGYALSAPLAVKYSVIFHVFLAGVFTYAFSRSSLGLGKTGSLVAALCFMFGGFLTQQVGHINQLNAAVWLPLVLLLFDLACRRRQPLFALLGGIALSAQVLAGHSQETFLLAVAFGLYALFRAGESVASRPSTSLRPVIWPAAVFTLIVGIGLGLSAAQLVPTFELSQESIRGGGMSFREASTFSLPPWLLARSLLPGFTESPFSEYIAYTGVVPLFLAAFALRGRRAAPMALFWLGLGVLAIFLAIGAYNPLYELIYKVVPPLRLFRVPARWLYLYAFALAALAGMGADRLIAWNSINSRLRSLASIAIWTAAALIPVGVVQIIANQVKEGVSTEIFWVWAGLILIAAATVHILPRSSSAAARTAVLVALVGGELFVAGSFLNSKNVTAPQADNSLRPTVAQLLQDRDLYRVLSISRTEFDPGDIGELKSIFGRSLDKDGIYQLLVAVKHQEALSPNIPMKYGIATLDGYDGGVLPLRRYVNFKELILGGVPLREAASLRGNQPDALLRDQLAGIPDTSLLGQLNVKYVLTDKLGDLWVDNVYYDLSTPVSVTMGSETVTVRPPGFQATSLGVIFQTADAGIPAFASAAISLQEWSGRSFNGSFSVQDARTLPHPGSYYVKLDFDDAYEAKDISLSFPGYVGQLVVRGLSLIDGRTGASQPLTLGGKLRLVHSGDLKIYENLLWQPRAYVSQNTLWAQNDQQALDLIRRRVEAARLGASADGPLVISPAPSAPSTAPVVTASAGKSGGQAIILDYHPERVLVRADMAGPGYLVLADSYYPGWRAYIDGQETPILKADYLFRAVRVPEGTHQVEFRYEPGSFRWGLTISLATLALMVIGGAGWVIYRKFV